MHSFKKIAVSFPENLFNFHNSILFLAKFSFFEQTYSDWPSLFQLTQYCFQYQGHSQIYAQQDTVPSGVGKGFSFSATLDLYKVSFQNFMIVVGFLTFLTCLSFLHYTLFHIFNFNVQWQMHKLILILFTLQLCALCVMGAASTGFVWESPLNLRSGAPTNKET